MFGIAKMAAIDPRLVDKNAKDEPQSKTNKAVEETLKALEDSKKFNGTAALFCDNFRRWDYTESGKRVEGFNIFEEIGRKLIEAGVPADQIVIMKSGMTTAAKEKIFAKVNAGEIRVIMGSTETLGTGVNIQERLFFEAHIDAPNRPMDYTQRMGRILRQGNLLKDWGIEARVVRFGVEDSLDVTAYQRLSTKSKFIDSVMNGKALVANSMENRVLEEEEEGVFDNPVAVLSGSQYALLKSQAERELRKLRNKKEQHKQDQIYIEKALKDNNNRIEFNQKLIEEGKKNLEKTKEAFPDGKVKEIAIEGKKVKPDQIAATLKEKITGPLREYLEKNRDNSYFHDETKEYNMTFDGVLVKISVAVSRTSGYDERLRRFSNQMHALVEYSAPKLGINGRTVPGGVTGISGIIPDFQEKIASGSYYENGIRTMENTISRLTSDNDLMLQRRGKPFADEEKLKQQEEIVKDYTEKMKAEMAEKEAKYAEVAKNANTTFNLDNVEVEDEPQGEDSTSYRDVDENAPKLDVNDPFVLAEAVSAVNRLARRIGLRVNFDETLDAKGAYTEGNDYVSINLANCESVDDAIETLLHEGVAHLGLRKLFGKEGFTEFINDILDNSSRSIRDAIDNLVAENGWSREYAAEEYIAELAQRTDYNKMERSFWRRVVDAVRNLISMITGRPARITDGTIREMLLASYENLGVENNDIDFYNENWEGYTHFRERTKPAPKKTGIGYKVFYRGRDGKLYPPMVANPNGEATPVGVWLDADAAPVAGQSKTGRPKVKAGGKGTQGGSGTLAYRPGWHLGEIPYAIQFNRINPETGRKELFPRDFVWAEVEYAADRDWQKEADAEGMTEDGKYRHSYAGLKQVPEDGFYRYRTNPNPETDTWIITGAMKVNKVLTDEEVDNLVRAAGREPQLREGKDNSFRAIARDLHDRYENQNGEDKPWMSERELLEQAQSQLPYGIATKPLFAMIDEYNRLDEEDFNEGRRDFSGGEMKNLFDRFLSALRDLGNSTVRNRTAGVEMFISNAENAVNAISMEKATPQQWLKMIESKGGLKAGEDKWIGLSDWLKASQKKTLTKQEVQDYINQNKIQIEEDRYIDAEDIAADGFEWNKAIIKRFGKEVFDAYHFEWDDDREIEIWIEDEDKAAELYNKFHKELGIEHELFTKPTDDYYSSVDMRWLNEFGLRMAQYGDEQMEKQFGKTINPTRIDYTTYNLDNKREIALTVPTIESWRERDKIHFGDAGDGRAIAWIRFGDTTIDRENWESALEEQAEFAKAMKAKYGEDAIKHLSGEERDQLVRLIKKANKAASRKRVLVIDEIQSKRHQEGREKGYRTPEEDAAQREYAEAGDRLEEYRKEVVDNHRWESSLSPKDALIKLGNIRDKERNREAYSKVDEQFTTLARLIQNWNAAFDKVIKQEGSVPAAPFEKNWHELAMKRMLRYAAENGYDAVAWTTGEQQAERYNIGEQISSIVKHDGNKFSFVFPNGTQLDITTDDNGVVTEVIDDSLTHTHFEGQPLSAIVGKELANKMFSMGEHTELTGNDLRIGGEGMKGFYDDILPRFMNKYGKKWGVSVMDMELPIGEDGKEVMHAVEVTPEMRESVMQGQLMFRQGGNYSPSPVSYSESMGAKRLAANETASKFGIDIEFRPSSEMRFNGMPLAGRWINGKMYVCLEHCRDNNDVVRTVLHEGVGHNGLRRLIGDENMRDFCLDLFTSLPKAVRNKIATDAVNKYGGNMVSSVENFTANDVIREIGKDAMFESTEEWLAETSETIDYDNYRKNVWDIIRDALRRVLAKVGINVPLSTRDVKWLMVQSAFANHENDALVEARRQVVAKGLGMTLRQQAEVGEARQNARNRLATEALAPAARIYNKDVMNWMSRLHETWVDKDDSVHRLVNAIEKATGKKAAAFEDIRLALNQQSSKGLAAIEKFEREHYQPMMDAIKALMEEKGCDLKDIERYVMIKHALERNEVFAKRDAREYYEAIHDANVRKIQDSNLEKDEKDRLITKEDAKLSKHYTAIENGTDVKYAELREQDYGGLTSLFSEYDDIEPFRQGIESNEEYQARVLQARHPKFQYIDANGRPVVDMEQTERAAQEEVDNFENGHAKSVDKLWKEINGATKATLLHQYQANMLSRDQYTKVRDMFKYYVPLRGFADNTAEDMYDYYRSDQRNDFTPPLLKAKGRKTEAESPFGYIGSMASSGIAADMKNETKLALYYFVSNRAKNDLVNISEVWYEKTGEDSDGKSIFSPVYPPFKEDLSSDEAKKEYEEWEKAMIEKAQDGLAFKGRRKLDLHNSVINIDNRQKNSHIIKFKVGGKDMMMYINGNPRAAQAINNELNVEMSTDYQKVFGKVLRWFSGINTSYNPEFWLSNAQRDALFALMSVNVKEDTEYNRAFRKNFGSLLRRTLTPGAKGGAYSLKKKLDEGRLGDDRLDKLYAEFVENGGVTGYTTLKNNE